MEKINYNIIGEGKAILLIHGWTHSSKAWHKVVKILSKKYKVITIDLPGHGVSESREENGKLLDYITDSVFEFISNNNISPYAIVAHSMGGLITLKMLRKYNLPLEKLMLLGTPYCGLPKWISLFGKQEKLNYKLFSLQKRLPTKLRNYTTKIGSKLTFKDLNNVDNSLYDSIFESSPFYAAKLFKELSENCFKLDEKLNVKSSFVARGEFDRLVSRDKLITLARFLDAEYYQFKGISHTIMLESPKELTEKIVEFCK